MKGKAKILKQDWYFLVIYVILLISKIFIFNRIKSIMLMPDDGSCLWNNPYCGNIECSTIPMLRLFVRLIIITFFISCIWYIIKIVKNKNLLLKYKIIRIIIVIIFGFVIILSGGGMV